MSNTPWDDNLKLLIRTSPQAFVDWLVPEGRFQRERSMNLKTWKLAADTFLEVAVGDELMLLHIEFQAKNDSNMPTRLLQYNVLAKSEHKLPVLSCVIYLRKSKAIKQSPLRWIVPPDREILQFHFVVVEVGELKPDDILHTGQAGLLPLLPFTEGGDKPEVIKAMLEELEQKNNQNLSLIGYTLALLVLKQNPEQDVEWLERSYKTMQEIFRESPVYQWILQEGREQGLEQGREQGREQGQLEALRQTSLSVLTARFPDLSNLGSQQINSAKNAETLQKFIVQVASAKDVQEVKQYLNTLT